MPFADTGEQARALAAVHAALDRDYRPMTAIFLDVIARTLLAQATASSTRNPS